LQEILFTDGKKFERRRADGTFEDLLLGRQFVFAAVALQPIEDEVRAGILKLSSEAVGRKVSKPTSARTA
jgi:hypothetical protein